MSLDTINVNLESDSYKRLTFWGNLLQLQLSFKLVQMMDSIEKYLQNILVYIYYFGGFGGRVQAQKARIPNLIFFVSFIVLGMSKPA